MKRTNRTSIFVCMLCVILAVASIVGCGSQPAATVTEPVAEAPIAQEASAPAEAEAVAEPEPEPLDYPKRAIELVTPYKSGGSHDLVGRAMASVAEKYLGKPLTITNMGGSSGALASDYVATSEPDGYTLLFAGSGPNTTLLWAEEGLPYARQETYEPICLINASPSAIIVSKDSPFNSIEDIIAAAAAAPDTLTYSSSGMYGVCHVPVEMLAKEASVSFVHVPFDGGGPALTAVLGKQVDFGCANITQCQSPYQAGDIRVLAVTGGERFGSLPEIPTLIELGYDINFVNGRFVVAPKGTDPAICAFLEKAFEEICKDPEFVEVMDNMGEEITYLNAKDMSDWWDADYYAQEEAVTAIAAAVKNQQ